MTSAETSCSVAKENVSNTKPTNPTADPNQLADKPLKPCCACPDSRKARDECVMAHGEEACHDLIEAHKTCLRSYGFEV